MPTTHERSPPITNLFFLSSNTADGQQFNMLFLKNGSLKDTRAIMEDPASLARMEQAAKVWVIIPHRSFMVESCNHNPKANTKGFFSSPVWLPLACGDPSFGPKEDAIRTPEFSKDPLMGRFQGCPFGVSNREPP